jgi:hypothetical protein
LEEEMALQDIRSSVPANALALVDQDEKVYFYGSGKGCLGGGSSFVLVTNERVVGSAIKPGGCLGGSSTGTVNLPLEHISSIQTSSTGGCLGIGSTQTVVVASGTAENVFSTSNAQQAASLIQQAMREAKRR